jgi:hypothetical protein
LMLAELLEHDHRQQTRTRPSSRDDNQSPCHLVR